MAAVAAARAEVPIALLTDRIRLGQQMQAERALDDAFAALADVLLGEVPTAQQLRAAATRGVSRAIVTALVDGAEAIDLPGMRFDRTNPLAVAWARQRAAELVRQITEESRAAVRAIIVRATRGELTPRTAARLIRDVVGLTERGAIAVARRREDLGASGLSAARVDAIVTRYVAELTRARALTIARTETIAASNEGQRQLWAQAQSAGLLGPNAERVWVVAPDRPDKAPPCPICTGLAGKTAPIGGTFLGGYSGPPAHPNCRCTTVLGRHR